MAQPVQPVEEPIDQLRNRSTGCTHPIEDRSRDAKKFISLLVAFSTRSRTDRGSIEAQWSPTKHLMLTASQPVDP